MNWLLHQLQKVLGALSGRRSNSRPLPDASDTTDKRDSDTALKDSPTSTQADISFSIRSEAASAQRPPVSQKDAIQRAVENADDVADTHMRIDAASSSIPNSGLVPSSSEDGPSDQLPSDESVTDVQNNQLPSIHDLLPAVEQEIKANSSAYSDEDETLVEPKAAGVDSVYSESENYTSSEVADSAQALLFSFDITESSSNVESASDVESDAEAESVAESVQTVSPSSEPINQENLPEILATPSFADEAASQSPIDDVAADADSDADAIAQYLEPDTTPLSEYPVQPLSDLNSTEEIAPENSLDDTFAEAGISADAIAPSPELDTIQTSDSPAQPSSTPSSTEDVESESATDSTPNASDATAFDKASLPYPWSIATPKKTPTSEDKPVLQQEDETQMRSQSEEKETTEQAVADASSPAPAATQPPQDSNHLTKNGVVKLLFTMKEGNFHGYIEPKDGTSDILFHQKYINEDIFDGLERGVEVVVSVEYKEGKAYATQVELA